LLIYKILLPSEWADFEAAGSFDGSQFDRDSGFVHCSSREQVGGVAVHVFARESTLVIATVDADVLGEAVRWEATPDGVYPHVYASLPLDAVVGVHRIDGAASVDEVLPRV
jgi:uncharacterized protein (DUF952 family)